jgi:hypothetical protein
MLRDRELGHSSYLIAIAQSMRPHRRVRKTIGRESRTLPGIGNIGYAEEEGIWCLGTPETKNRCQVGRFRHIMQGK